jgi:hypothetical protein
MSAEGLPQEPNLDRPMFDSSNVQIVVVVGNEDTTVRPIPPGLMPWVLYERERQANPTQPSRIPRPSTPST